MYVCHRSFISRGMLDVKVFAVFDSELSSDTLLSPGRPVFASPRGGMLEDDNDVSAPVRFKMFVA